MDPSCPNRHCTTTPLNLRPQCAATPLWTLIPLPQHHQTLPDPRDHPLARYQRGGGETLALLCKEEEKNDAILDPFGSPSLHRFNPLCHAHLTLHSILIQEHGSLDPIKHLVQPPRHRCASRHLEGETGRVAPCWARRGVPRWPLASPWPEEGPR
jgi:hypothetical protein